MKIKKKEATSFQDFRFLFPVGLAAMTCDRCAIGDQRGPSPRETRASLWTFLVVLSAVIRGQDHVLGDQLGERTYRAPKNCSSLPQHCTSGLAVAAAPWVCQPRTSCSIKKSICTLPAQNSSSNDVNLTASVFYIKQNVGSCWQALNLTWMSRPNDYVGFYLKLIFTSPARNTFNHSTEKRFIVNRKKLNPQSENRTEPVLFYYDCQRLAIASSYRFVLYGLQDSSYASCLSPELIGVSTLATDCDTYPEADKSIRKWLPFINIILDDENSTVKVYFSPAPHSFGFTSYHVLLRAKETRQLEMGEILGRTSALPFTCTNYGAVVFKRVCSGEYKIEVRAVGENCPCIGCDDCDIEKNVLVSGSPYLCPSEILVEFPAFEVSTLSIQTADSVSTETRLSKKESINFTTSMESRSGDSEKTSVTIGAVVFAAITIAVVVAFVMLSRNCKNVNGQSIKKQSVLLIYAKDNAYHCNAVQYFALYLQKQCHCDVKFDQWCPDEISKISAFDWLLLQIKSVENIIIINSEAGWRQYEGNARSVAYRRIKYDTPIEDMFLLAVKELCSKRQRIFKVAFPYTHSKYFISDDTHPGRTYVLMSQIEDMFSGIHQLSKYSMSGKKLAVDINASNYAKCREGQLLETAIKEAADYFQATPDWFSKFYYKKEEKTGPVGCLPLCEALLKDNHSSPIFDSGLGTSADHSITSNVLKMLFDEEVHDFKFYPPSDVDDDVNSVSSSNIEAVFELMNIDYENDMT